MSTPTYLSEIRALLERDQIPAAVGKLKRLLQNSPLLSEVLAQSSRHRAMVHGVIAGTVTVGQGGDIKNDIRRSLLLLIDEIEQQQQQKPEIKQELAAAVEMLRACDRRTQMFLLLNRFGLGLLLIVGLLAVFLYVLRDRIWPESFMLTVLVHGEGGIDDLILKDQGEVRLDVGTGRFEAKVNERGEATFKEIPGLYIGRSCTLTIDHPQPYKATKPDEQYVLRKDAALYLEVSLTGLDSVFGYVRDATTERMLQGVRISSRDIETYTNAHGWYSLKFPPNAQQKFVTLWAEKPGYRIDRIDSVPPHLNKELIITLHHEK